MKSIKNIFFTGGLPELNDFNREIIDSAPMSIMITNKTGNIVFVNKYFRKVSSGKHPLLKNIFKSKFFIEQGLCDSYRELLDQGKGFTRDDCPSADKSKYLNIVAVPLKNKEGEVEGALSMAIDVTETVEAKKKLKKLNLQLEEKIEEKVKQLRQVNEKLEESLELKLRFVSDASHELRTPLAVAKLNLEFLKKQLSDKNSLESLSSIDYEINKVSDILSDISFFTAINNNVPAKINAEEINVTKVIKNASDKLKIRAEEKNIDIILKKCEHNPVIIGDEAKLEKLFLNIIGNSIKYGKKSGWVKIFFDLDFNNKLLKVVISDNGIGIPKKDLPFVFERFYRANLSKNKADGGFGLGLSVCKWIVDQHRGFICVESTVNRGTVFTATLPLA